MAAALTLPSFVCLKSAYNDKYLRYRHEDVQTHGLLIFGADDVMDPYAQFQVEKAKTGDGLIHLKSRYTGKYLVRWSPAHYWITSSSDEPNETQNSWMCTLFKPIAVEGSGDTQKIRLEHVQLGLNVILKNDGVSDPFISCLIAYGHGPDNTNFLDVVTVVDWESIFKLPKRVAFKADNGFYLGAQTFNNDQPGLQFSFQNPKDPKVVQQIFTTPDGTLYIKSEYYGKFWRRSDDNEWIVADAEDPRGTDKNAAMFRHTALGVDHAALLNMGNTKFVKRYTVVGMESFLSANIINIDIHSRLEVVNVDK